MNLSGRICAMLRYRPWQYTKYSLRALPCLTQIRLGNLSQRLIEEEYKPYIVKRRKCLQSLIFGKSGEIVRQFRLYFFRPRT